MVNICCVSDLHGMLPDIPDCDLLFIAGDIVPLWAQNNRDISYAWLDSSFREWLLKLFNRGIITVGIAGNHDFVFEDGYFPRNLFWKYLQDEQVEFKGLKIWGTPWQPTFYNWAFNAEEEVLEQKWDMIPKDTDVIIVHGPPYLHGDRVKDTHVGSPSLLRKIKEIKPKLVVCGHIHESYGCYHVDNSVVVNCCLVNDSYKLTRKPILWEI